MFLAPYVFKHCSNFIKTCAVNMKELIEKIWKSGLLYFLIRDLLYNDEDSKQVNLHNIKLMKKELSMQMLHSIVIVIIFYNY